MAKKFNSPSAKMLKNASFEEAVESFEAVNNASPDDVYQATLDTPIKTAEGFVASSTLLNSVIIDINNEDYELKGTQKALGIKKTSALLKTMSEGITSIVKSCGTLGLYKQASNLRQNNRNHIIAFVTAWIAQIQKNVIDTYGKGKNFVSLTDKNNPFEYAVYTAKDSCMVYDGDAKRQYILLDFNPTSHLRDCLKASGFTNVGTYRLWYRDNIEADTCAAFKGYANQFATLLNNAYDNEVRIWQGRKRGTKDVK